MQIRKEVVMHSFSAMLALIFALSVPWFASANVLGNMQTFQPTPDLTDFETVHSSRTMPEGRFNVGLFVSYLKNDLTVFDQLGTANARYLSYKDSSWQYDLVGAWAILDSLTLTLTTSGVLSQQSEDNQVVNNSNRDIYITRGTQTLRPGLKYSLRDDPNGWGVAAAGSVDFPTASEDPYVGNSPKPIYNIEAILDWYKGDSGVGFNLGYRSRTPGSTPVNPVMYPLKDQLTFSAAYVYGLTKNLRYHFEAFGASPITKNDYPSSGHEDSLEAMAALRFLVWPDFWAHLGGTIELASGGLSPDYRGFIGANIFFGETQKKKSAPLAKQSTEIPDVDTNTLFADPQEVEVYTGYRQIIAVSGGVAPLSYSVKNGFGTYDASKQTYRAPYQVGETELIVRDAQDKVLRVPIHVVEIPKAQKTIELHNLNFIFGTAKLTRQARRELNKNFDELRDVKIKKIILIGHTDNVGSDEINLTLSRERAETVRRAMINYLHLREDQVDAVGAGKNQPIATNATEAGRATNRRVELRLYRDN